MTEKKNLINQINELKKSGANITRIMEIIEFENAINRKEGK